MAGPDLEINIKTRADVQALRQLETSLKAQIASLKKLGQDASGAESQLKKVQSALRAAPIKNGWFHQAADGLRNIKAQGNAAAGAITGLAGLITAPMAAVSAVVGAVAAAFAGATAAVREFAESEEAIVTLDAALAQNQLLTEENRERYQSLADELQATTKIADETWLRVLAQLTLFGSKPESIGMDIEAVKNLAALLGGGESGVVGAANLWSKALNGNFAWLRRYNIVLDEGLPRHEKLVALMRELADRAGGQLEARTKTLTGSWRDMRNKLSDLAEGFGALLAVGVRPLISAWMFGYEKTEKFRKGLLSLIDTSSGLKNSTKATQQSLDDEGAAMGTLADRTRAAEEALKNLQAAQEEATDASVALRVAGIDSLETRGLITKEDAIRRRLRIREAAADEKANSKIQNNQAEIDSLKATIPDLPDTADRQNALRTEIASILAGGIEKGTPYGKYQENKLADFRQQLSQLDVAEQAARTTRGSSYDRIAALEAQNEAIRRGRGANRARERLSSADAIFEERAQQSRDIGGPNAAIDPKAGMDLLASTQAMVAEVKALLDQLRFSTAETRRQMGNGGGR